MHFGLEGKINFENGQQKHLLNASSSQAIMEGASNQSLAKHVSLTLESISNFCPSIQVSQPAVSLSCSAYKYRGILTRQTTKRAALINPISSQIFKKKKQTRAKVSSCYQSKPSPHIIF